MKLREKAMIKALLTHYHQSNDLLRFLPHEAQEEIKLLGSPSKLEFHKVLSSRRWLSTIHYSWLLPILERLPKETQTLFFPLFNGRQTKGLREALKIEPFETSVSQFTLLFLSDYLKNKLQKEEVIPYEILPKSALNPLVKTKWQHLMQIIDRLGLFDLACDCKQIVDKSLIEKVYNALTEDEKAFLSYATKQPAKWVSPKLGLQGWDGQPRKLKILLHQRGLNRLAKGIVDENLSFRWHLVHRFDTGRAQVLIKALSEPIDRAHTPMFKNQILQIAKMVTK